MSARWVRCVGDATATISSIRFLTDPFQDADPSGRAFRFQFRAGFSLSHYGLIQDAAVTWGEVAKTRTGCSIAAIIAGARTGASDVRDLVTKKQPPTALTRLKGCGVWVNV